MAKTNTGATKRSRSTTTKKKKKPAPKVRSTKADTPRMADRLPAALGPNNRRSLGFIGALAFCGFTMLSLASYSPMDPAFSRRSSVEQIQNWCGRWGALEADVLLQLLGWSAWAVAPLAVWLWLRFARREAASLGRLGALFFGTWWSATLLGLLFHPDGLGSYPHGGALGAGTATWLLEHVGAVGSYVLVLVMMVGAATLLFDIHWERLAGRGVEAVESNGPVVQGAVVSGLGRARSQAVEAFAGWKARRQERAEARYAAMAEDDVAPASVVEVDEDALYARHSPAPATGPGPRLGLDIEIDRPEPVIDMGMENGLTGVRFDAEAPVPTENPTQVQQRELVEVEYEPTDLGRTSATPAQPEARREPAVIPTPPPSAYDVTPVNPSLPGRPSMPPYVDESAMGDGSVYSEPAARVSALDPMEPRFVTPVDFDEEPPDLKELPPEASPTLEPEDEASSASATDAWPERLGQPHTDDLPEEDIPAAIIPTPAPQAPAASTTGAKVVPGNLVSGGADAPKDLIKRPSQPDICWELPNIGLLDTHDRSVGVLDEQALKDMAAALVQKLADFNVRGEVVAIRPGPVITIFEYLPAPGVKVSRIAGLTDDIAMAMRALRVRIVAPIPGKGVVGIEIPNKKRQTVWYRDMLTSREFRGEDWTLPMALGKTTEGRPRVADLSKMPHLLVGGTTGSGKSVGVNSMLMTMLYARTPDELRLILIDPKMLEFELYNDIPHLLHPVVTEPRLANAALQWTCKEMDDRYRILARWGTRNIASYNKKVERELEDWTPKKARRYAPRTRGGGDEWQSYRPAKLPYIVVVIDELADLMMVASKEVEESIVRLAQKARACGIHLIVATQRPSVDVITGLIKANMPSRIAFQVRSKTDGRTILDQNGAETLLGKGDMLYLPPGVSALERCHGAFVADDEVARVCDFWREQGEPVYTDEIRLEEESGLGDIADEEYDENYDLAVQIVTEAGKASTSMIQRRLRIGYNRAARIIDLMEREGVVGPADGARPRKVLVGSIEA